MLLNLCQLDSLEDEAKFLERNAADRDQIPSFSHGLQALLQAGNWFPIGPAEPLHGMHTWLLSAPSSRESIYSVVLCIPKGGASTCLNLP